MSSENKNENRQILQASRPSQSGRLPKSKQFTTTVTEITSRGSKRKSSDNTHAEYDKKIKTTSPPSKGNFANRRLENLRRSLTDVSARPCSSSVNISGRDLVNKAIQRRSVQDRLKVKGVKSAEVHSLNKSLPAILDDTIKVNFDVFKSKSEIEKNVCDFEFMDWEENVIENVIEVRRELSSKDDSDVSSTTLVNVLMPIENEPNLPPQQVLNEKSIHIVVDTNIFISHLNLIVKLKNTKLEGKSILIFIPWMVLQELDYMKLENKERLGPASKRAINFINDCLSEKDSNVLGQNVMDASKQNIYSNNPDDGILFSCLQLKNQNKNVVLLSNDVNLRNKAMFSSIPAYSHDKIITELDLNGKKSSIERITILMKNCLNEIIKMEMSTAYGKDVWLKMVKILPPYNLEECLNLLCKYWIPIFSLKLLKQCKPCLDEFKCFVQKNRIDSSFVSSELEIKLIEYCLRLCIYLKNGCSEKRQLVTDTINALQKSNDA